MIKIRIKKQSQKKKQFSIQNMAKNSYESTNGVLQQYFPYKQWQLY